MNPELQSIETYQATIYMAGDIDVAKQKLRELCYREGLCVTITPTTFIYTGGEEQGFMVGLTQYPKFPKVPGAIFQRAIYLANDLIPACCQRTALVIATDRTMWISIDPPGAPK